MTKIVIDGTEIEIGVNELNDIIYAIKDHEANQVLFAKFSKHASAKVRRTIADKSKIDSETAKTLATDKDIEVLRAVVRNEAFRGIAEDTDLTRMIQMEDIDLCNYIVFGLEYFENCDADKIINLLVSSKDPNIRMAAAENWNTPKKILKKFAADEDLDVRRSAHRDD